MKINAGISGASGRSVADAGVLALVSGQVLLAPKPKNTIIHRSTGEPHKAWILTANLSPNVDDGGHRLDRPPTAHE